MHDNCCSKFAHQYGMPVEFVHSVLPEPAISLAEYASQQDTLEAELSRHEACQHIASHARIYLRKRCDESFRAYVEFAHFMGWSPKDVEAEIYDEVMNG